MVGTEIFRLTIKNENVCIKINVFKHLKHITFPMLLHHMFNIDTVVVN